jgi:hypothetical protein
MTARPDGVVLVGQLFTIEWVDNSDQAVPLAKPTKSGRMDLARQRIIIDTDNGPDQLRDVTLHEVLHACFALVAEHNPSDVEEHMVSMLAPVLLDALRSNPGFVNWLTEQ